MAIMITSACMNFSGNSHEACTKAAEAGSKQSGFEQNIDAIQKDVERKADAKAHDYFGDTGMEIAGGGVFIVKTVVDKSVKFNAPTFGICDRITNQVGIDKYSILLEWGF